MIFKKALHRQVHINQCFQVLYRVNGSYLNSVRDDHRVIEGKTFKIIQLRLSSSVTNLTDQLPALYYVIY